MLRAGTGLRHWSHRRRRPAGSRHVANDAVKAARYARKLVDVDSVRRVRCEVIMRVSVDRRIGNHKRWIAELLERPVIRPVDARDESWRHAPDRRKCGAAPERVDHRMEKRA